METLITLSDGKKEFSFKVVGIDPKEFRQKMIDFVEIDVNILLSLPKEKERETRFLQSTQFCGLTESQLEYWFFRHGSKLEFQND